MISNLTRRGVGAGIGPPCVTVLTALPTFAQGPPVRIGLHVRRCEGGCRLWGRTNREVRQIVGHHQENLAL
jgi:hypothetical protein